MRKLTLALVVLALLLLLAAPAAARPVEPPVTRLDNGLALIGHDVVAVASTPAATLSSVCHQLRYEPFDISIPTRRFVPIPQ
ncbi:MAG TPA: hypothetical protein VLG28_14140 [Acidimicrobiia bacterium]|jgi:hypothetical protein|nr:hypothetical protein [Acidimicrobiia bacterium]